MRCQKGIPGYFRTRACQIKARLRRANENRFNRTWMRRVVVEARSRHDPNLSHNNIVASLLSSNSSQKESVKGSLYKLVAKDD
jgi:hypothetical protein